MMKRIQSFVQASRSLAAASSLSSRVTFSALLSRSDPLHVLQPAALTHDEHAALVRHYREATHNDPYLSARGFPDVESALLQLLLRADIHIPMKKLKRILAVVIPARESASPGGPAKGAIVSSASPRVKLITGNEEEEGEFDDKQQQQQKESTVDSLPPLTSVTFSEFIEIVRYIKSLSRYIAENNGRDPGSDNDGQRGDDEAVVNEDFLNTTASSGGKHLLQQLFDSTSSLFGSPNAKKPTAFSSSPQLVDVRSSQDLASTSNSGSSQQSAGQQQQQLQRQAPQLMTHAPRSLLNHRKSIDLTLATMNESTASHPFFGMTSSSNTPITNFQQVSRNNNNNSNSNNAGGVSSAGGTAGSDFSLRNSAGESPTRRESESSMSLSHSLNYQESTGFAFSSPDDDKLNNTINYNNNNNGNGNAPHLMARSNNESPPVVPVAATVTDAFASFKIFQSIEGVASTTFSRHQAAAVAAAVAAYNASAENEAAARSQRSLPPLQSNRLRTQLREIINSHRENVAAHKSTAVTMMKQTAAVGGVAMQMQRSDGSPIKRGAFAVQHTRFSAFHFSPPLKHGEPTDLPLFVRGKPVPMKIRDVEEQRRIMDVRKGKVEGAGRARLRCRTCTPDLKPSRFDLAACRTMPGSGVTERHPPVNKSLMWAAAETIVELRKTPEPRIEPQPRIYGAWLGLR